MSDLSDDPVIHKISRLRSRQGMEITIERNVSAADDHRLATDLKITASMTPPPDEIEFVLINKDALGTERTVLGMNLVKGDQPGTFVSDFTGDAFDVDGFCPSISFVARTAGTDHEWQIDPINRTKFFNFAWTW